MVIDSVKPKESFVCAKPNETGFVLKDLIHLHRFIFLQQIIMLLRAIAFPAKFNQQKVVAM